MNEQLNQLYNSLKKGPAFLFLGQNYFHAESNVDPFLNEILRKYGSTDLQVQTYYDIFTGEAQNSPSESLAWMQGRCQRFQPPNIIKTISQFTWNGVYSSSIDLIWQNSFRSEWRDLQPIFNEKYYPNNPRNQHNLHCTYLFGRVDRDDESERPPLNQREMYKRKQVAISLARRLPELITPLGVILIEGYNYATDWFLLEDLLSTIVDELNPGQSHLFSTNDDILKNEYASLLVKEKKIIIHSESLASFFMRSKEQGLLQLGLPPVEKKLGRELTLQNQILSIPNSIWTQVSRSATILNDSLLASPAEISLDTRYREFRSFLSESGTTPIWSGYARQFAFKREFEFELRKQVDQKLSIKTLHDEPILVSGQTGTGKSIALGRLAYELRQDSNYPVLFIDCNTKNPSNNDIDAFCRWLKEVWDDSGKSSVPTTIIIWDANDIDSYYSFLKYLSGRGHRVVLVGSSYKQKSGVGIQAPVEFSKNEITGFTEFLNSFEPTLGQELQHFTSRQDGTFLVALYRLLPATRALIRNGINKEYAIIEREISRIAHQKFDKAENNPNLYGTTLSYALVKAGYIKDSQLLSDNKEFFGGEEVNQTQKLFGLVMVPGSLGLRIPFELLLRTLGKNDRIHFTELLSNFDIFYWHQDEVGNMTIGPRHQLEAKLWTYSNIGGAKYEVDYVKKLLIELKDDESYNNIEVQFAVELVRSMGPNNRDNDDRYCSFLKDIAETLSELREKRSIEHPRLMLQEATFLREYVRYQNQVGMETFGTDDVIDKAEIVLNEAIKLLNQNPKTKGIYYGELATIHGTRFLQSLRDSSSIAKKIELFKVASEFAFLAWSIDTENYNPLDVLCWTTRDFLNLENVPSSQRLDAEVNILHAFDIAESEEYGSFNETKLNERRYEIGRVLNKEELTDKAFEELKKSGSSAGFYLKAFNMISNINLNERLNEIQRKTFLDTVEYLENNKENIKQDGRSLFLLLRIWWMAKTGRPLFFEEKQVVPFTDDDWVYCIKILDSLIYSYDKLYSTTKFIYLKGLATFHLKHYRESFEIFKQLEKESEYKTGRRRIIRSYLVSKPSGEAKKFSGEVKWVAPDGTKGGVFVSEIRYVINFSPRDFNKPDIKKGESIGEFHIAFNFLGPSADPLSYLKSQRGKS